MTILDTHYQQHSSIYVELFSVSKSYRHCALHFAPAETFCVSLSHHQTHGFCLWNLPTCWGSDPSGVVVLKVP